MRILFATPVPPLSTKPRPHYFIRGLAGRGHAIHLLTLVQSRTAAAELDRRPGWPEIVNACVSIDLVVMKRRASLRQCLLALPTRTPLRVAYCRSKALSERAHELVRRHGIDILHVDRERLGPIFAPMPVTKVLDSTDCITRYLIQVMRYGRWHDRFISGLELVRMRDFEATMNRDYAACLLASEDDARAVHELGFSGKLEILSNGVDDAFFARGERKVDGRLVFVGNMSYPPNVDAALWFAREVLPLIKMAKPDVSLHIVGNQPSRAVRRLGRWPGIEVTGGVPDVAPILRRAMVSVAPIRIGGGFPNKVAEALAAGVPTVATSEGFAGIPELVPGIHLLEANDAAGFARRTLDLLSDPSLRARIGEAGRDFMVMRFRWPKVIAELEEIYQSSLSRGSIRGRAS